MKGITAVLKKYAGSRYEVDAGFPKAIKAGWLLRLVDTHLRIKMDITVNKTAELHNTNLVLQYCKLEPRFVKVMHFLKEHNQEGHWSWKLNNFSL